MPRPRKYQTVAEAQEARRLKDKERKRQQRAIAHALKADPSKRKDAAVNMRNYPVAPVDDETLNIIDEIMNAAGELTFSGLPVDLGRGRYAAALMIEWEEEHTLRLPALAEEVLLHGHTSKGVPITTRTGKGYWWNKLYSTLKIIAHFMERNGKNKLKAERHAVKEKAEADASGLTVQQLRGRKDAEAKRKWEKKTQAEYHRKNEERVLQKRQERIERESTEKMLQKDKFGQF